MIISCCPKCGSNNISTTGVCANCGWSLFARCVTSSDVYNPIGDMEFEAAGKALLDDYKRLLIENNSLAARIAELDAVGDALALSVQAATDVLPLEIASEHYIAELVYKVHDWVNITRKEHYDSPVENIITRLPAETTSDGLWNARPIEDELRKRIAELEVENAELKSRVAELEVTAAFKSLNEMGYIEQIINLRTELDKARTHIAELKEANEVLETAYGILQDECSTLYRHGDSDDTMPPEVQE